MAVHPAFFRQGIADSLLRFIENRYKAINKILVSTGKENKPAVNLYLKRGYSKVEDVKVKEGFYLTLFEKVREGDNKNE